MTGSRRRHWSDLSTGAQVAIVAAGAVQFGLAVTAWWDLGHRPAAQVRGPKAAWAAGIAVNWVGPIAYFTLGRRPSRAAELRAG